MDKLFAALGGSAKLVELIVKIVIAAIIFFAIRSLYLKWKKRNAGKAFVDTQALNPAVNYDNVAKGVHDVFDNFLWTLDGVINDECKALLLFNDNELKHINNRYLEIYGKGTRTLQDAVNSVVCLGCSYRDLLLARLEKLNLN